MTPFPRNLLAAALAHLALASLAGSAPARSGELLLIDNGTVKVGIDRAKGAAITWLSWAEYPKNMVNSADPGRLIQQSYYAGHRLDRKADGQSKSWSPWSWNPIQGGAVFSPAATQPWNFGPHAGGSSDDPAAGPCMHVAPIDRVNLGPKSAYRYRYWLVVGTEAQLAARLDALWKKYADERAALTNP